jgi:hypothetical protein
MLQVKVLTFHPVQPWLAYADVNQALTVWDWSSQQANCPQALVLFDSFIEHVATRDPPKQASG